MAKFIGSKLHDNNWGEDYFIKKLMEYFDDSYVIYRNRSVFGAQFDVCLLVPKIGIIIFEVKAWKAETIKRVVNSDSIVIKTIDSETGIEGESEENPTIQARGYVYKMRSKIRQKTGKTPLVYEMVCFPNLTKQEYLVKGIEPVCEYETTILKDDLANKGAFYAKMNLCMKNHKAALKHCSVFNQELLFRVRQIFETDLKLENQSMEDTDTLEDYDYPNKTSYSILAYIPHEANAMKHIKALVDEYCLGTKLYLLVENKTELFRIQEMILNAVTQKGLMVNGLNLEIDFSGKSNNNPIVDDRSFLAFNCSAYLIPSTDFQQSYWTIKDGAIDSNEKRKLLKIADAETNFNIEQYEIEHSDIKKNVIVRAGAGTGKTFTMILRIAFICHVQNCSMKEMINRIVMITFTDDAANQMEDKIKQHFNNYYLLTGDTDCLAFINQIEGMQISTIHSYAKKIISQLGFEFGYGTELGITSGDYKLKQIIAKTVDEYIVQKQKEKGNLYIKDLGMPVYLINKDILGMLMRLHNQSIDVATLKSENFGEAANEGTAVHELLVTVIPQIEAEFSEYLRKDNRVHLNNMMSMLEACIKNEKNIQRLLRMQTGRPQFMFVDEFQDTDDVQIDALTTIAELLQYKLFVVGDVKQCIYRFRGAKENAFDQLNYKDKDSWNVFSLSKNYRTDGNLLNVFHETFLSMGKQIVDGEQLLIYGNTGDESSDRLIGTRSYNSSFERNIFYRKVTISDETQRLPALFEEVRRQKDIILDVEKRLGKKLDSKEREIAILVRENWQAEIIKKAGKALGYEVVTNTGGDLYMSEPALDMLTLANALLHYDESDYLYAFVSSNFIGGGMSKARMYAIRENSNKSSWKKSKSTDTNQARELQQIINRELSISEDDRWKDWNSVIRSLRTVPVLQVVRKLYYLLKPWVNYGEDNKLKQDNYRLNVDLLFEELINTSNMDSVTINSLVGILSANIISQKNVDSRVPDMKSEDAIIKCVTVHKAKGLEYGAVILPYCSASINIMKRTDMNVSVINGDKTRVGYQIKVPDDTGTRVYQNSFFDESLEKNERMREEARILYVAMTRAIRTFSWIALDGKKNKCWQNLLWEEK